MSPKIYSLLICNLLLIVSCKENKTEDKIVESIDEIIINQRTKTRIDSVLKGFVDSGNIAGVSALIFEKDREVYFNAFGYADREAKRTMDRNTISS